jgi:intracellular sulfur oxidation DsrE/DsrF family protein
MDADSRVIYIANIISAIFGTNSFEDKIMKSPEVAEFLNNMNSTSLEVVTNGSKVKFLLDSFNNIEDGFQDVHFVKRQLEEITASDIANQLMISSMRRSPLESLYHYMKVVYEPLLVNESGAEGSISPQLMNLVSSLKAGLATSLRKGHSGRVAADENNLNGILSPIDEIEFWESIKNMNVQNNTDEKLREKGEMISKHFEPISKSLYQIENLKIAQVLELIEQISDTSDYLFTDTNIEPAYGEPRMKHFLKITTASVGAKVENELNKLEVWSAPFSDVRMKLNDCMRICTTWKEKMVQNTGNYWKATGMWKAATYYDPYFERLINRLNEIHELRKQHDELMRLLSPDEQTSLDVGSAFDPFRSINCFYHNEYQNHHWERAKALYQDNLKQMANHLCERLRKEIFAEK